MKTVILNDTSIYKHFGCRQVMKSLRRNLEQRGVEVVGTVPSKEHWCGYRDVIDKADFLVINGEGSLHGDRVYNDLLLTTYDIEDNPPAVLLNTSWENVPRRWARCLGSFDFVFVRESCSKTAMEMQGFCGARVVPDLIFDEHFERAPVHALRTLLRMDSAAHPRDHFEMKGMPLDFWERAKNYDAWYTGRFHAVAIALIAGVPFRAYPSNTQKILGMLLDAGLNDFYDPAYRDGGHARFALTDDKTKEKAKTYVARARQAIASMFDTIVSFYR